MSGSLISHQYVENSPGSQEKNGSSSSQEKDDYSVNPNQKVYDMPHQLDHEVNGVKIYFAEQKPKMKWESKEESYSVQSVNGATVKSIKDKKEGDLKKLKKEFKNIQVLDSADNTKMLSDGTKLKKGESVKIKWEENIHQQDEDGKPAYDPLQINKASVKKKVWVVANCEGTSGNLSIQINENKLENGEQVYENPIKFLIGEEEKDKIEFKIDGRMVYQQEITLRPKSDDDLKKLVEKFDQRKDKNAFLYFKAEITETQNEITFPDETHEFLNKDGERLEIKYCSCCDYTVDNEGYVVGSKVTKNKIDSCNKTAMPNDVAIIVLHRTAGGKASGTLNHMKSEGYGAHFVIDYDGTIYHAISLNNKGSHMGVAQFQATKDAGWGNGNSIAIETCGYSYDKDGNKRIGAAGDKVPHDHWEEVTNEQAKSVACLLDFLITHYNLTINEVKVHEDLCSKEPLEGKTVYDAMLPYLCL
ncbi:peptidoglycan recognition protein family protein [Chryseobacterium luquanense]|uniref:N-acetylmuramoyl-L-alanine amidase n=1 Tax=Chryseobacterium luquanense TaxID=2983766 RepID=A0ABT3Y4V5_9FLAO|nr:peptidoglycan recognition family protein [Chryseobacterium luquanense]MCX8533188.1 N-acetylmuramoyl-L-alanine amidase [Chryseobacterium luquanense]